MSELVQIISSLLDQARDKDVLANGDDSSIFARDARMLREAANKLSVRKIDGDKAVSDIRERFCVGCKLQGVFCIRCKVYQTCQMVNNAQMVNDETTEAEWDVNGRCTSCGGHAPFWAMASTYYRSPYCHECGRRMKNAASESGKMY